MPFFAYRAKRGPKEVVDGTIEAGTQDEAVDKLSALGLLPVRLNEVSAPAAPSAPRPTEKKSRHKEGGQVAPSVQASATPLLKRSLFGRIRSSEITLFGRQMASLMKAGVPILHALKIILEQSENPRLRNLLSYAHDEIKNGRPLSDVLSEYPKYFPPIYIAMVRTGEDSGTLQEVLLRISDYRERQEEVFSHVRMALAYPALMLMTGVGTIIFMLAFVIPRLTKLFSSMGGNLPLPTRILMNLSSIFQSQWFWIGAGVFIFAASAFVKTKPQTVHALWSRFSLKLPIIHGFVLKSELARFSRTLELLIKSGVSILRAIEISTPVLGNLVLRNQLVKTHTDLEGGGSLGESLRQSGLFPLFMTNLIAVGEQSGNLDEALAEVAQFYERQTNEAVKVMTSLLEPLMILGMGLVVGFIVIAMLLPMFELNMIVK